MKLLWHSNAPGAPTGYGNQTGLFVPRIHGTNGFQVVVSSVYGIQLPMSTADGILMLPALWEDHFGNGTIQAHFDFTKPDVVFSLIDPFALEADIWKRLPWAAWAPVDSEPDKPGNVARLRLARWVVAMSQFGKKVLENAGLDPVYYVPHGIDTNVFKPINREEARKNLSVALGVDLTGKKVVVTNSANKGFPSRKNFDALLQAWQGLLQQLPDAVLILHTERDGRMNGEHLPTMIKTLNLPDNSVLFPRQYQYLMGMIGTDYLNDLYNAADLYVQPSQGEGFGIPIVEAQAAGCPVVVTNFSSMPELVFAGKTVDGFPVMSTPGSFQRKISVPAFMRAMLEILTSDNADYLKLREQAREGALAYDIERVFKKYMLPVLEQIKSDVVPKVSLANRREIRRLKRQAKNGRHEPRPDVSVLIPAFKKAGTVQRAVNAALAQEGVAVEVLVIDSNPEPLHIEEDERVKVIRHPEQGYDFDMNTAASQARGEYIQICEADDWLEAGALAAMKKALDEHPSIGFVYGAIQYHGRSNHRFVPGAFRRENFFQFNASCYPVMFRKSIFDAGVRWWQSSHGIGANDWEFNMQLAKAADGLALPDVLVLHYHFQEGTAWDAMQEHSEEIMNEIRERHPECKAVMIP